VLLVGHNQRSEAVLTEWNEVVSLVESVNNQKADERTAILRWYGHVMRSPELVQFSPFRPSAGQTRSTGVQCSAAGASSGGFAEGEDPYKVRLLTARQ
jgi:hypothetical protein